MNRIILAITGASGAILGIRTLELLKEAGVETHLIVSRAAERTITSETDWAVADVKALASACYDPQDIGARIASGSFVTGGMLVVPCSIKTLSGIANSYADNLVGRTRDPPASRAFAVDATGSRCRRRHFSSGSRLLWEGANRG
jgi:4-hydroxy-3-polyprenylbenzoate decarboxylase